MITRIKCPACSWSHDEPALSAEASDPMSLAGVFGPGVMAAAAAAQRSQRIERVLEEHFRGHTIIDWIRAIRTLEGVVSTLEEQLRMERELHVLVVEAAVGGSVGE